MGPGRASHKEGESWDIMAKYSLAWTQRSYALRLRRVAEVQFLGEID
jgi:hypothetical protein